ncbi:MAG: RecQ family ATP-dependent DNA helicase [Bacteroidales bacterium]|nr:RecQ family ATP-dependent DNA helicase [Bacteroidales bacterium]
MPDNTTTSSKIHQILKRYWGYNQFRPLQEDIILSVLEHKDTLALLPTGGGKSICFQVPALAMDGLCIVISPLIALMKDQVENLKKRGIKAEAIYSGKSKHETELIINNATFDKEFKFLYVSPERLKTDAFRLNISKMPVSMFAVDEAHCISQWGYDFRPPYLEIAEIRKYFPQAPILALTATATPEVVKDIQLRLDFKKENVFQKSFRRANLTYFVVKEEDKNNRMLRIMNRYPGTGVVYVRNRRKTQEVAQFLSEHGISADFYHAGLDGETRDRKQNAWMRGETRVIVSTNAFGMGIDKPDVRFVIHIDIPDTLEAYFQEAGRGGRDEKPAVAIMLYDNNDVRELKRTFALTFPPIDVIKNCYETLCENFNIPVHSGKGYSHLFDIEHFSKSNGLNITQTYNSINFLEKMGLLILVEDEERVSVVKVLMNHFEYFEKTQPKLSDFLKTLLRSYTGLFTTYAKINESEIARRTGETEEAVIEKLKELNRLKVISYRPKTTKPVMIFLEERVEKKCLYIDPKIYEQRKKVAEKRLKSVLDYVADEETCRSQLLLQYFGEMKSPACGNCDGCLRHKHTKLPATDFENIAKEIKESFGKQKITLKQLLYKFSNRYDEEKVLEVLRWLIDNNQIAPDSFL